MKKLWKKFLLEIRFIFLLKPKNWNAEKEKQYQMWASTQPNMKSLFL